MLAHTASMQGEIAAENAFGAQKKYNDDTVPACVYTTPEFASVGLNEEAALAQGYSCEIGRLYEFLGLN